MAKVYQLPNHEEWEQRENESIDAYFARQDALLEKLRADGEAKPGVLGKIIRTPRADGYAMYMVYNTKPLQLCHIPFGDAWHADPIWLNGLRLKDVEAMIEKARRFAELFR